MATSSKYAYDKSLDGCSVATSDGVVKLNDKVSQKDLKKLFELGVQGITKQGEKE